MSSYMAWSEKKIDINKTVQHKRAITYSGCGT